MVKVCVAEVSTPPLAVPPLSVMRRMMVATPSAAGLVAKLSTPVDETDGPALNKPGLSLAVISNDTVCEPSLGPAEMPVAHAMLTAVGMPRVWLVIGPTLPPAVKLGTSLTQVTVTVTFADEPPVIE